MRENTIIKPMKKNSAYTKFALLLVAAVTFTAASARADTYSWTNFQSDIAGVAQHTDPNLINPWGMAASSNGTNGIIWASDNGTGVSTLYHQDGTAVSLVVTIPTAKQNRGTGNPTGVVSNTTQSFPVTKNGTSLPARFIFVSEDGSISGWNPTLDGTHAIIAVDNGTNRGVNSAVYKSATLGVANGHNFLYVSNFHTGSVETYDENFHQVTPNGFTDPNLPAGYAPFGIRNFNNEIFVTYAKQDHAKHDDVAGPGFGFVNVFDTSGNFLRRLISNGNLNAPWGLARLMANFGLAISGMDSLTFTIRPLLRLSSRRSCALMEHHSSSTAFGTFSRWVAEFISPLESQTKHTASLALSLRTLKEAKLGGRTHPCLPLRRSCPGKGVRSPCGEHRSSHALRIRSDGITSWQGNERGRPLRHLNSL